MGRGRVIGLVLAAVGAISMTFGLGVWLLTLYLYLSYLGGCGIQGLCYAPPSPAFLFVGLFGGLLVITGIGLTLRDRGRATSP